MSAFAQGLQWLTSGASWSGSGGIPARLGEHVLLSLAALLLAAAVALPLGVCAGHTGRGGGLAVALAGTARAVPTLAVLTLLVLRLGIGNRPVVLALALFALPPMAVNAYTGVRGVDPDVRDAARGMGMSGRQVLRRVELPLALPLVAAGLRTAAVQVVATATIAAIVGSGGLGRFIVDGFQTGDRGQLLGGVVLVVALALLTEWALGRLQRRLGSTAGLRAP